MLKKPTPSVARCVPSWSVIVQLNPALITGFTSDADEIFSPVDNEGSNAPKLYWLSVVSADASSFLLTTPPCSPALMYWFLFT